MSNPTPGTSPQIFTREEQRRHAANERAIEAKVTEANLKFYRALASKYDEYEIGISDPFIQRCLENDLDKIESHFASLGQMPSCLECGGGTGNLTLKMCARGWVVTVVDVSAEMLNILETKAHSQRFPLKLIHAPIERFLETNFEKFDLVAFSAVLHHLYSYTTIVKQAASCLRRGGVFYSNYDPVIPKRPAWTWTFDSLDIAVTKVMFDPSDVLPGVWRRLRKIVSRRDPSLGRRVVSPGDIAEFHVRSGVDDANIVRLLKERGFAILEHLRYATGRTSAIRFLNERLRLLESFKIIAQRISEAGVTCERP